MRYLLPLLVVLAPLMAHAQAPAKTRILFIGANPDHPPATHEYMHTSNVLARCVEHAPGVEAIVTKGWPKDAKTLEGVKAIVYFGPPGAEALLGGKDREQVENTLKKGVGLATIHWASSMRKDNVDTLGPVWLSYTGGSWVSNVGLSSGKSPLKQLLPDHPVCRGWKEFEIDDEYYLNPTIKGAKPLLQVREKNGKDVIVGWVYERPDKSRAFGTTLGHFYRNFQMEPFRRMVTNGILWTANVEVPAGGANVDVDEKTLALPPVVKK